MGVATVVAPPELRHATHGDRQLATRRACAICARARAAPPPWATSVELWPSGGKPPRGRTTDLPMLGLSHSTGASHRDRPGTRHPATCHRLQLRLGPAPRRRNRSRAGPATRPSRIASGCGDDGVLPVRPAAVRGPDRSRRSHERAESHGSDQQAGDVAHGARVTTERHAEQQHRHGAADDGSATPDPDQFVPRQLRAPTCSVCRVAPPCAQDRPRRPVLHLCGLRRRRTAGTQRNGLVIALDALECESPRVRPARPRSARQPTSVIDILGDGGRQPL